VALMQPSIQLLRYLDIWPGILEAQTAPLRKLRIIDDTGSLLVAPNLDTALRRGVVAAIRCGQSGVPHRSLWPARAGTRRPLNQSR
jgi:hypothetical protein